MALIGNVNGDIKRNMAFDKMVISIIVFYMKGFLFMIVYMLMGNSTITFMTYYVAQ